MDMKWLIGVSVLGLCLCVGCSRKVTEHLTFNTDSLRLGHNYTHSGMTAVEIESLFIAPMLLDSGVLIAAPRSPQATSFHYGFGLRQSPPPSPALVPVVVKKKTVTEISHSDSAWSDTTVTHAKAEQVVQTKKPFDWATFLAGALLMVLVVVILKYLFVDSSRKSG